MTDKAELSEAFNALLDELRGIEQKLLTAEPALSEPDLLDGYRLTFSLLRQRRRLRVGATGTSPSWSTSSAHTSSGAATIRMPSISSHR